MSAALAYGAALAAAGGLVATAMSSAERARLALRLGVVVRTGRAGAFRPWGRLLSRAGVALAASLLGYRLAGPVGAVGLVMALAALERSSRAARERRVSETAEEQLRDAITGLAAATRAGLSVRRALREVLRDAEPPLRDRLAQAVGRLDVGEPLDASLAPVSQGSADGRLLVAVLSVHSRVGGDLPGLLDELSSLLALRLRGRRQGRALTAQARASGAVLAVLPIAFVGLLSGTSGAALGAFYRTAHGSILLLTGFLLESVGFLWLRRLARGGEA